MTSRIEVETQTRKERAAQAVIDGLEAFYASQDRTVIVKASEASEDSFAIFEGESHIGTISAVDARAKIRDWQRDSIRTENGRRLKIIAKTGDSSTLRDDIHRRGAFRPDDYECFGWYYLVWGVGSEAAGSKVRVSKEVEAFLGSEEAQDYKAMMYGDFGKCGICGNVFVSGEIWKHKDTLDLLHVGCDCTAKYKLLSGIDWSALADERERYLKGQRTRARRYADAKAFRRAVPDVDAILAGDHYLLRSFRAQFERDGYLSNRQVETARRLQNEAKTIAATKANEPKKVPVPYVGPARILVRGTIVSRKSYDSPYGEQIKMTVKVTTPEGEWLCWGTQPTALLGSMIEATAQIGDEVEFSAQLEAGREAHFAFFRRPTNARIVRRQTKEEMVAEVNAKAAVQVAKWKSEGKVA